MINKLKIAQGAVDAGNALFAQMNLQIVIRHDGFVIQGADYRLAKLYRRIVTFEQVDQGFEDLLRLEVESVVRLLGARQ